MNKYFGRLSTDMEEIYLHFCKIMNCEREHYFLGVSLLNNFSDTTRMSELIIVITLNNHSYSKEHCQMCWMQPITHRELYLNRKFSYKWGSLEPDIYLAWYDFTQLADTAPQMDRKTKFAVETAPPTGLLGQLQEAYD